MDAGPERPAETPRSSASVEGFDEMCDAPLVASELASRMVISRFWGSFPEPVSKMVMSSNSCARNSKSLPVSRDKFRIISEATVSMLGICQRSPLLDATGASKFWGKDGNGIDLPHGQNALSKDRSGASIPADFSGFRGGLSAGNFPRIDPSGVRPVEVKRVVNRPNLLMA
jgi:hypothetical protein